MVTLRMMTADDLDAILTIQQGSPEAAQWPAAEWRIFCETRNAPTIAIPRAGHFAWVAVQENGIVGFLASLFSGEELEILNLAIAVDTRRRGIAAALLAQAMNAARKAGARRVFLEVRASNEGAIAFYEQQGFLPAGVRKDYYRQPVEDALILARTI